MPIEVTDQYIRIRQRDPGDFSEMRTIVVSKDRGIKAVYGKLKGESAWAIQSYLFEVDKWTEAEAAAWIKDHKTAMSQNPSRECLFGMSDGRILAAENNVLKVMVIKAGISQNRNPKTGRPYYYEPSALKAAISLFEGRPAYAFEFNPNYFSHVPAGTPSVVKIGAGLVKSMVGLYTNAQWSTDHEGNEGIVCDLTLTDEKIYRTIKAAWDAGLHDFVGYSIDGGAELQVKKIGGLEVDAATLQIIDSIDIVTSPAAGGKTLDMRAALEQIAEGGRRMDPKLRELVGKFFALRRPQALTRMLESTDPGKHDEIAAQELKNAADALVKEAGTEQMVTLLKEAMAAMQNGQKDIAIAKMTEALQLIEKVVPAAAAVADGKKVVETPVAAATKAAAVPVADPALQARLDTLENKIKLQDAEMAVAKMTEQVTASNLPNPVKESLVKMMVDTVRATGYNQQRVTEAISAQQTTLEKLGFGGGLPGHVGARFVGNAKTDAFHALLATMRGESVKNEATGHTCRPFRSLREAARDCCGVTTDLSTEEFLAECFGKGYNSGVYNRHFHDRMEHLQEAVSTSTWSVLLGDVFTRSMIDAYMEPQLQGYRKVVSRVSNPKDFQLNKRYRYGGYNILPVVGEKQPYLALTSPGVEKVEFSIAKRGGLEFLTLEAIAADDLGAVKDIPKNLGRAAALTLWYLIMETIRGNGGLIYDGKALYHADHSNTGTLALDRDNYIAVRKKMRKQLPYGAQAAAAKLGLQNLPKVLWIGTTLEEVAEILTKARTIPQKAAGTAGGFDVTKYLPNTEMPNFALGMDYETIDYWDDDSTTLWFLTGDPRNTPMIELGFWEGREEPELFTEAPMTGSQLASDTITHKVRHAHGHCVLDWRGFQKGNA